MRNGHWLRGNARTMIPSRHLLLATTLTKSEDAFGANALDTWYVRQCRWQDSGLIVEDGWSGQASWLCWHRMQSCADEKAATVIWLNCPREDVPALNFTGLVEDGHFDRKYWVWADPPIIIAGKLCGRRVKLLGIENWIDGWRCEHDSADVKCALLHQAVETVLRFVHREDLGHLRSTVAGQSFQAYRHLSLPGKIGIHTNQAALDLERSCPIGHPVIPRAWGKVPGPIYVCDVNALFPYVMGNYPYPRKLLWRTTTATVDELKRACISELVIARVSGFTGSEPALVQRKTGALYVNHLEQDVLCGVDLDRVLNAGNVHCCHEACAYEGAGIFAKWSDWAMMLRERYRELGTDVEHQIAKALTTRLWSQFAARLKRWIAYPEHPTGKDMYGEYWHHTEEGADFLCRAIGGIHDRMETHDEPDDSFPAISAFVAAYARDYVRRLCAVAGWENVLYVVADALHVNLAGYARLQQFGIIHPTRPGACKVAKEVSEATYLAPNVLVQDGVLTQAGRPQTAKEGPAGTWTWYSTNCLASEIVRAPDGSVHQQWHHATTPVECQSGAQAGLAR